ncbi:MAG: hotdog domain-containing protein, partial [Acidimicrobiales bacterium]
GVSGSVERVVADDHTAIAVGSGDVAVLSTPTVLAWAEAACVAALDGALAPTETTVGARIQLDHTQPTSVGGTVVVSAVLELVEGRRLTFSFEATDPRGTLAVGRIVRVLVDRDRFLERSVE